MEFKTIDRAKAFGKELYGTGLLSKKIGEVFMKNLKSDY